MNGIAWIGQTESDQLEDANIALYLQLFRP